MALPTAALLLGLAITVSASTRQVTVRWHNHRLTVESGGAPVYQVLAEIARQTGMRLEGADTLRHNIDAHFVNVPLGYVLRQLLGGVNFALVEQNCAGDERCLTLIILGERSSDRVSENNTSAEGATQRKHSNDGDQRLQQIYEAAEEGNLDVLKQAVSANDADATREVALDLLAQKDSAAAANLALTAATSSDLGRRVMGLQALATVDSPAAVRALREALDDPDEGVKQTALASLAQQPSATAQRLVRDAADDSDPIIQTLAENLLHTERR